MSTPKLKKSTCEYDSLIDITKDDHLPTCARKPFLCTCPDVRHFYALTSFEKESLISSSDGGKWMVFLSNEHVDDVWIQIKTLLAARRLRDVAKVSRCYKGYNGIKTKEHVICVYTPDYRNVSDVFQVLVTLHQSRIGQHFGLKYKTNLATNNAEFMSEEATVRAGFDAAFYHDFQKRKHPKQIIPMYTSPKLKRDATHSVNGIFLVKMFQHNIGPDYEQGLVAEVIKKRSVVTENGVEIESDVTTIIYDPPIIS